MGDSLGLFFGSALVAGALDPSIGGAVMVAGTVTAIMALLVELVIAVVWVMDLWESE